MFPLFHFNESFCKLFTKKVHIYFTGARLVIELILGTISYYIWYSISIMFNLVSIFSLQETCSLKNFIVTVIKPIDFSLKKKKIFMSNSRNNFHNSVCIELFCRYRKQPPNTLGWGGGHVYKCDHYQCYESVR